jgi:hypothetical protein
MSSKHESRLAFDLKGRKKSKYSHDLSIHTSLLLGTGQQDAPCACKSASASSDWSQALLNRVTYRRMSRSRSAASQLTTARAAIASLPCSSSLLYSCSDSLRHTCLERGKNPLPTPVLLMFCTNCIGRGWLMPVLNVKLASSGHGAA